MPIPGPPRRQCARYSVAGRRCARMTIRYDRWCGECDGFTQAIEPSMEDRTKKAEENEAVRNRQASTKASERTYEKVPLEAEDLADLGVSRGAIRTFLERHGGDEDAARRQLLSLAEDCITSGKAFRSPSGYWILSVQRGTYGVNLDPELTLVTSYRTVHLERTWAQVKAGVKSRLNGRSK